MPLEVADDAVERMKAHLTASQDSLSRPQLIVRTALGLMLIGGVFAGIFVGLEAYTHPLNQSPFDQRWAQLYGVVLIGIGLFTWLWRGRLLILTTPLGVVAFVMLNITRAHTGVAWLVLAWLLMVSAGLGSKTLRWFASPIKVSTLERLILAIAVGLGELALLTLAMGLFHVLHRELGYAILSGLTILFLPATLGFSRRLVKLAGEVRSMWQDSDMRVSSVGLSVFGTCLLGALVWAVAPSIHYDALNYHLGVPAIYVQQHAVVEVPEEYRSYWAHNAEMLYTLALALVGQPLPTLIHLTFGLLTTGLVFSLGKRLAGTRVGLIAAVLFYSLPIVTWESGTAYTDLMVTLYTFGTLYAAAVWWLEQDEAWLTVAGLMAGFGLGTKLNAILVLFPVSLFIASGLLFRYGVSRRCLMGLLRFGVPTSLLVAPWLLRDWLWTGNPIFPFFNAIFQSSKSSRRNMFPRFAMWGMGHRILDLVRLPWDLVAHAGEFGEATLGGTASVPLLALPWLYLHEFREKRHLLTLCFLVGISVMLWFWVGRYLRYLLPIFPALALLAALNIEALWLRFSKHRWRKQIAIAGLVTALSYIAATRAVYTVWGWQIPDRYPYRVALGLETPERFLSRAVPVYDSLQFLDQQEDGKHRVFSIGSEFRMYTSSRIFPIHSSQEAGRIASLPPEANLAQTLERQGYDFLLVNQNEIKARPGMYQLSVLDGTFLHHFTRLVFAKRNVYVYRLQPDGSEISSRPAKNLLTNGGFEETGDQGSLVGWFAHGGGVIDRTGDRAHSGRVAAQASRDAGFFQRVPVVPGKLYTLGHWTRADHRDQFGRLQINWLDGSLGLVDVSIDVIPTGAKWQWHQMSATAPRNAVLAQVYVSVHENSQVWFDGFQFVQGNVYTKQ